MNSLQNSYTLVGTRNNVQQYRDVSGRLFFKSIAPKNEEMYNSLQRVYTSLERFTFDDVDLIDDLPKQPVVGRHAVTTFAQLSRTLVQNNRSNNILDSNWSEPRSVVLSRKSGKLGLTITGNSFLLVLLLLKNVLHSICKTWGQK